eukprot:SAG31_NODE_684_length_12833_cov_8.046411_3_plen_173_part_00
MSRTTQIWDTDSPMISNISGAPVLNSGQRTGCNPAPHGAAAGRCTQEVKVDVSVRKEPGCVTQVIFRRRTRWTADQNEGERPMDAKPGQQQQRHLPSCQRNYSKFRWGPKLRCIGSSTRSTQKSSCSPTGKRSLCLYLVRIRSITKVCPRQRSFCSSDLSIQLAPRRSLRNG